MALKDQPYLPLYVQDYLSDEKLNQCDICSEGVYIRLMLNMHKSKHYGKIHLNVLDKAKLKQSASKAQANDEQKELLKILNISEVDFAMLCIKIESLIRRDFNRIYAALLDLVVNGVIAFDGEWLSQKRMVTDGQKSMIRASAGSKGGRKGKQTTSKPKPKSKQNTEYEYEYESESEIRVNKNDELKNEILEDQQFVMNTRKAYSINQNEFQERLNSFFIEKETLETDDWKEYSDCRKNFFYWIKTFKPGKNQTRAKTSEHGIYTDREYKELLSHPHTIKIAGGSKIKLDDQGKAIYVQNDQYKSENSKKEDFKPAPNVQNLTEGILKNINQ